MYKYVRKPYEIYIKRTSAPTLSVSLYAESRPTLAVPLTSEGNTSLPEYNFQELLPPKRTQNGT